MPESRNRPNHPHQKKAAIPARQRVKGRILWAVLFGVFALLIALFAVRDNLAILVLAAIAGAAIGYVVGKQMEQAAKT